MPYWPTNRGVAFDPSRQQWITRWYTIPHGWFTAGPFDSFEEAEQWAQRVDSAVRDIEILPATKRSPWKSMRDPNR